MMAENIYRQFLLPPISPFTQFLIFLDVNLPVEYYLYSDKLLSVIMYSLLSHLMLRQRGFFPLAPRGNDLLFQFANYYILEYSNIVISQLTESHKSPAYSLFV